MLFGKWKFLFLLILCLPQLMVGYCTKGKWDVPGAWAEFDYLLLWRKARFLPALASTGTLGDPGVELLFGDAFESSNTPRSGFRFDGGIWCSDKLAFGGGLILIANDPIEFFANTNEFPSLARPYINASTNTPTSLPLVPFGSIFVKNINHFNSVEGYLRLQCWDYSWGGISGITGPFYFQLEDHLDITSFSNSVIYRRSDHFDCSNNFYSWMGGIIGEWIVNCWQINVWGKLATGNMVIKTHIYGDKGIFLAPNGEGGLLAQPSNIGRYTCNKQEFVSMCGANLNWEVCCGLFLSVGYLGIYIPQVALAGNQVDLHVDLTQRLHEPEFRLHETNFWYQGLTFGISAYY